MRGVTLVWPNAREDTKGGLLKANQKIDLVGRTSWNWDLYESSEWSAENSDLLHSHAESIKSFPVNQIKDKRRDGLKVEFTSSSAIDPETYKKYTLIFSNNEDVEAFMKEGTLHSRG